MYTHKILDKCDPKNPYAPKFSGTFELPVEYAGKKRRMLAYVPHDIRGYSCAGRKRPDG